MAVHIALRFPELGGDAGGEVHLDVRDVLVGHEGGRIGLFEHFFGQFDAGMLIEPGDEAMDDEGIEVVRIKQLAEDLLRILFELARGLEVIGDAVTRAFHLLLAAFCHEFAILFLELGELGVFAIDARHQRFGAALEDAVERVVVARGDGIEFVIVAACTGDGECLRAAHDDINAVVDDVVRDAEKAAAEREEAHRGEIRRVWRHNLICGDLQQQKAVVGHVRIQRLHDPVAVGGGMDPVLFLAGIDVAFGVGVARNVQPVAGLLFAVVRAREERVDERFISLMGRIGMLRWQPGEIKVSAANQRAGIGASGGRGLEIGVDAVRFAGLQRLEGPVLRVKRRGKHE